ncbi:alpha/beta hydrolase (plasmid) [Agrobacterium leguminum]|uniref:Alpha/beta hydrolase n=1 Tax=Agrobacterium deltaense NCPPB 1641 TaxID=1183425 RepID=A0A1S7U941_9HYPH|nr:MULTISPECIES: alpha/beta hydrolase [Agrobacterium]WFS70023.1 alpha/beta hydrolase [Agrobacterium leguminum]CVI63282.1 putative Alpha/beta hydrolase [Agrobacterium deltaense NCPPB 1641]
MRTIEIEGSSIEHAWFSSETEESDRSRKAPIVFLHHGFGCVADWKGFPQKVAHITGHPALAYSRQGCGGSSPPPKVHDENYLHEEARQFLPRLLDALSVEQCHLYGHSDGATIALLFASAFPDRVRSAVVEAPHVFAEQITLDGVRALTERFETDPFLLRKLARYHRDAVGAFQGWSQPWSLPQFRDWTIVGELDKLSLPLLVIQGSSDPFGTMEHARLIARCAGRLPSILELPESGHNPHIDAEQVTLDAVAEFLHGVEDDTGYGAR